jgi:hypothetical protein
MMRTRDHNPPHLHLITAKSEAMIEIATGSVLAGAADRRILMIVTRWIAANRDDLLALWARYNPRGGKEI